MKFEQRAFCKKCGWSDTCWNGDLFFLHADCCPKCGNEKPSHPSYSSWNNWKTLIVRFMTTKRHFFKQNYGYYQTTNGTTVDLMYLNH